MRPRPILIVREPLSTGEPLNAEFSRVLANEGYLVVRGDAATMQDFRLVAACPFTPDDVAFLKGGEITPHPAADADTVQAFLESLADRIAGMLASEDLKAPGGSAVADPFLHAVGPIGEKPTKLAGVIDIPFEQLKNRTPAQVHVVLNIALEEARNRMVEWLRENEEVVNGG